jgi:hypothetical protein
MRGSLYFDAGSRSRGFTSQKPGRLGFCSAPQSDDWATQRRHLAPVTEPQLENDTRFGK